MRARDVFLCGLLGAGLAASCITAVSPAMAQVNTPNKAVSPNNVQDFLANPATLLADHPTGGALLVARVRDLSSSDPATLDALIGLLPGANSEQASAIGLGLGQTAMIVVKTNQAYANQIQQAIVGADESQNAVPANAVGTGPGSAKPKIGSAVKTINEVEGVTETGPQPVATGSEVYRDELVRTGASGKAELLFADHTNLTIGPVTEIRLDKFVYDPDGGKGNVVIEASEGTFRFITGVQSHRNYAIKTPFATLGMRGTTVLVKVGGEFVEVQIVEGEMFGTTIKNLRFELKDPKWGMKIDRDGNLYPSPVTTPLVTFADLGAPQTNMTQSSARNAFAAVTGNGSSIGAAGIGGEGAGGGGGGGGGTGGTGTGQTNTLGGANFNSTGTFNLRTAVATTPPPFLTLQILTAGTSGAAASSTQDISPFTVRP